MNGDGRTMLMVVTDKEMVLVSARFHAYKDEVNGTLT